MNENDFYELRQPEFNPHGWFVSSVDRLQYQYLHPDLLLHESTGCDDPTLWPGYFNNENEAMIVRDKYYALHSNNNNNNHDTAYDRAMEGI